MADTPDFAKGATTGPGYDTTPGGLGLSPAYLGGATATASLSASSSSGTSFPAVPADGQEYVYVADATNGVFWRFRWYAASSYWAFIGGGPLTSEVATDEGHTGSGTYIDLATVGPSIILPFAGDYDCEWGCNTYDTAAANLAMYMGLKLGASATSDTQAEWSGSNAANESTTESRFMRLSGLGAVTIKAQYKSGTATTRFRRRWLEITPVKK